MVIENLRSESDLRSRNLSDDGSGQDWEVDLRSLPIVINEHDLGYNKVLTMQSVLSAFKTSGRQAAFRKESQAAASSNGEPIKKSSATKTSEHIPESETLRRQEARLQAYCSVYDIESGKMVHYLKQEKMLNEKKQSEYLYQQNLAYYQLRNKMKTGKKSSILKRFKKKLAGLK